MWACVRACARARVRACVRARVDTCVSQGLSLSQVDDASCALLSIFIQNLIQCRSDVAKQLLGN